MNRRTRLQKSRCASLGGRASGTMLHPGDSWQRIEPLSAIDDDAAQAVVMRGSVEGCESGHFGAVVDSDVGIAVRLRPQFGTRGAERQQGQFAGPARLEGCGMPVASGRCAGTIAGGPTGPHLQSRLPQNSQRRISRSGKEPGGLPGPAARDDCGGGEASQKTSEDTGAQRSGRGTVARKTATGAGQTDPTPSSSG